MTGKSLGLRSGSYGSLQHQQRQQLRNFVALPIHSPPLYLRKHPKMLLSGSREKERFLHWIFRISCRVKFVMPFLFIVSISLLCFLFSIATKDPSDLETNLGSSKHVQNFIYPGWPSLSHFTPPFFPIKENIVNTGSPTDQLSATHDNHIQPPTPVYPSNAIFTRHPCESFSFPPPPVDRKRTGPRPCPVCYVSVEQAKELMPPLPSTSPVLKNLRYISEVNLVENELYGGLTFGGHPSLHQRDESFDIKESMAVHCGFVKGKKPGQGTGFDIDDADLLEMEQCHGIVVASAIFGNYDIVQEPKNISEFSERNVCFYMFVDEETEASIKNSSTLDQSNRLGLWRRVVVRNLPYSDARRNGKVPKLLLHRLFPNVRFSIWIDGKLDLVVDPYQILERFLWRKNVTFAISRHYKRFDVFEEAEANKAAGKYDNASIDYQIEFYKREGLTHYSPAKLPIMSDVPEGCVIIREHIPITNLFTCLWFNEVERFTSRDQISFSTVRDKIRSRVNWTADMFMDCERRNFVVQSYHKDLLEQIHTAPSTPPPVETHARRQILVPSGKLPMKTPMRHGRDRKYGSRRHRSKTINGRDNRLL
ncbi:probable hexosyltransferase MUCI70 [Typha latifolia]|uniref:probable hexosyltransferase MUCI70 n=1 Tax=Typha latifolia TaxID=4733 RepID=UPI003C2E6B51